MISRGVAISIARGVVAMVCGLFFAHFYFFYFFFVIMCSLFLGTKSFMQR